MQSTVSDSPSGCGVPGAFERARSLTWQLHRRLGSVQEALARDPELEQSASFQSAIIVELLDAYRELSLLDPVLGADERERVVGEHRVLVQPALLSVPLIRRAVDRPFGYAGDYVMVEMIFGNGPAAGTPFASMLERVVLASAPSAAHRFRAPWAHDWLVQLARELGRPPRVLSFACGPETILREHLRRGGALDIVLCDHDPRALDHARAGLAPWQRADGSIEAMQLSALSLIRNSHKNWFAEAAPRDGFDAVLVLGLFDYLRAGLVQRLMRTFHSLLRPGGLVLASNLACGNPHQSLMEYVADWRVIHRDESELERLMLAETRFTPLELRRDPHAANLLFAGRA